MNIAFDATAILGTMSKNRGIGNYAFDLFKTAIENDPDNEYYFLNFIEDYQFSSSLENVNNFHEIYFYCGENNFMFKGGIYDSILGDIIINFIDKYQIDLFYITSPFEADFFAYKKEWFLNTKVISIVYDIIPYVMKEDYFKNEDIHGYMLRIEMLKWMDQYLAISQSVKDDMVNLLDFDPDKINVIYGAVSKKFIKISISDAEKEIIKNRFSITSSFILCTGGDDERKNLAGLIKAYAKMPQELIRQFQLVIVCKLSVSTIERYTTLAQKLHIGGRIVMTNYVTDDELVKLYNMAILMAFPSKYEGFGLPIVEAWACGLPVLTSNNSSLGEIAGDAAILVDPFSVDDISKGLVEALKYTNLETLAEKGKKRLQQFKWDKVCALLIQAREKINIDSIEKQTFQTKIAFFTPLPPMQSGISDYSVDLLNTLSIYFDIDVFIDDGYCTNAKLNKGITVLNHRKFRPQNYEKIIYQVGNSEFHTYMFSYIQKYNGIVELHDENIHIVAHSISLAKRNDLKLYRAYLSEDYSDEIVNSYINDIKNGKTGPKFYELPLNGFVTNYASKIIVHSSTAKELLLKKNIHRNIKIIQLCTEIEQLVDSNKAKQSMDFEKDTIIFSSFGFIANTKRAMPIMKAFKRISDRYSNIHYCFVGKGDGTENEIYKYLKQNNLEDKVTITGFIGMDMFQKYIDATDICLNLRYPYNGESSSSLMRILSKGKCVMINDIGSFREIPDDCCIKLPSVETVSETDEVEYIYKAFEQLLMDQALRNSLGEKAREYAEQNLDIQNICKEYISFVRQNNIPTLNEKHLRSCIDEIKEKKYTLQQIRDLATTLAFSKNAQ